MLAISKKHNFLGLIQSGVGLNHGKMEEAEEL